MNDLFKSNRVYTVLELNTAVRKLIKDEFPQSVWVCGEIQDLRMSRDRRHIYFNFVQKHPEEDEIVARVSAAIFEGRKFQIFRRLKESGSGLELKDDIEVKLLCEVDLYPKNGNFSLIISDIDPVYTLGKIAQNRQRIIEDLRRRGVLEKNKLLSIPQVPLKVGLITAFSSAAYHDFTHELKTSGFSFKVLAANCHMQGKLVEKEVAAALNYFNGLSSDALDVIVITRGGGSTADLSYFDSKKIAESIATSQFPVVAALGHEINTTITDLAANTTCKTPTKAGQFLVEKVRALVEELSFLGGEILEKAETLISGSRKGLESLTVKIESTTFRYFRVHREELLESKHRIFTAVSMAVRKEQEFLKRCFDSLKACLERMTGYYRERLKFIEDKLKILDPRNILKRGYSITFKGRKAVIAVNDLKKGDKLTTLLYRGEVESEVKQVKSGD